jgi:hypothetical protein
MSDIREMKMQWLIVHIYTKLEPICLKTTDWLQFLFSSFLSEFEETEVNLLLP